MARGSNTALNNLGIQPYIDFAIAAGGTQYEADVTVQFLDADGQAVERPFVFTYYTCSDAQGATPADDASSAHSDGGSGALIGSLDDDKHGLFVTNASGEAVITITDTAKTANYLAVVDPRTGELHVSRAFATADYKA